MDLYQVRYFLTIAETGTFSRAAERLYLSQPSLSAGIKKLEQELGVALFERGGRRTVLTAAGQAFKERATVIMAQYQAALHELKGFNDRPTLKVGVLSTLRVSELADLVHSFQQQYPHVTLEMYDHPADALQDKLTQGAVDVAITMLGQQDDAQTSTLLFTQPLLLAVPARHPLAQRTSVRLAELDGQPYIDRVNCEFFKQECQLLEAQKISPQIVYRASHEEWVISLVKAGLGMSMMPYWRGLTDIVYLPVVDVDFQRRVGIKWRLQCSEMVEQFCRFATSHNWESMAGGI